MSIESINNSSICGRATRLSDEVRFYFNPYHGSLDFLNTNELTKVLRQYQFQFEKILRSALSRKQIVGQTIRCVFIDDFHFLSETDYNQFIRLNRRDSRLEISTSEEQTKGISRLYTDGSFDPNSSSAGYGGLIQYADSTREVFCQSFTTGDSGLMELLAVLDGLKRLQSERAIQVNTDSRFVIRGMVQWMHFWRHNGWQTAYGCQVKYAGYWQQLYQLSENKLIEFNWIKGHSGHVEQDFCHHLARKSANIS